MLSNFYNKDKEEHYIKWTYYENYHDIGEEIVVNGVKYIITRKEQLHDKTWAWYGIKIN